MTVTKNLFKPKTSYTIFSLQNLLKTYKSLPKTPPNHWSNINFRSNPDLDFNDTVTNELNLNHPLLQKLDSCTNLTQFNQVQAQLIVLGIFQHSLTGSRVIKKLSSLPNALNVAVSIFEKLDKPDAFMCNVIVKGYLNKGELENAMRFYYCHVICGGIVPNHYTFPLLIRVCDEFGSGLEGEKAHCRVLKCGFGFDLFVKNSLIRMYNVFGRIWDAQKVFDESSESDLVTWNTLIDGYVKNGELGLARKFFDEMWERDAVTWNSMLGGYVGVGDMEAAIELFEAMPFRDCVSWNCLIDGCAKIGDISASHQCFNRMPNHNVVAWNTMLALHVRSKEYDECLRLFDRMIEEGEAQPNEATLVSVLTACGYLGRLDQGKWVHQYIECNKRITPDVLLYTSLLTMYTKCGDMDMARHVFDSMPEKSVVSWNSMIMGYGSHGLGDQALEIFMEMGKSGQVPNDATFVCVLAACAHSGKVLEGWWYFDIMSSFYKIEPKVEHYGCMLDLLGKAGLLTDAEKFVKEMPTEGGWASWGALLSACHTHSNSELGELVAKWLIEHEPEDVGAYLLLSNIYAAGGQWEEMEEIRRLMKERGLHKVAGYSASCFGENELKNCVKDGSIHRKSMVSSMLRNISSPVKLSRGLSQPIV